MRYLMKAGQLIILQWWILITIFRISLVNYLARHLFRRRPLSIRMVEMSKSASASINSRKFPSSGAADAGVSSWTESFAPKLIASCRCIIEKQFEKELSRRDSDPWKRPESLLAFHDPPPAYQERPQMGPVELQTIWWLKQSKDLQIAITSLLNFKKFNLGTKPWKNHEIVVLTKVVVSNLFFLLPDPRGEEWFPISFAHFLHWVGLTSIK